LLVLVLVLGCRAAPPPAKDAVQEAFRDDGLTTQQAEGHRLFVQRCATCHGTQGRGDGQNAYNLDPVPPDFQQSLAKLPVEQRRRLVESGSRAIGRSPLCPPRGASLTPDDVDALLAWLEVASRPAPGGTSEPAPRWRRRASGP
jgi:mono/diheme cytochrome c family protein